MRNLNLSKSAEQVEKGEIYSRKWKPERRGEGVLNSCRLVGTVGNDHHGNQEFEAAVSLD
jgi:hypothetical protein